MNCDFSNEELELLSAALIIAIQNNNEAAKLTVSQKAVSDLIICNTALRKLNTKICNLMEESDDAP